MVGTEVIFKYPNCLERFIEELDTLHVLSSLETVPGITLSHVSTPTLYI